VNVCDKHTNLPGNIVDYNCEKFILQAPGVSDKARTNFFRKKNLKKSLIIVAASRRPLPCLMPTHMPKPVANVIKHFTAVS
jgi:hypothetical protein